MAARISGRRENHDLPRGAANGHAPKNGGERRDGAPAGKEGEAKLDWLEEATQKWQGLFSPKK